MTTNNFKNNKGSSNSVSNKSSEKGLPVFFHSEKIIGSCSLIKKTLLNASKISLSDAPVLITGESGTGKDLFADFIHYSGSRKDNPFIKINCASIPEHLFETELFGHIKGAFTDASKDRKGKFISADKGTLFLDEVFELPLSMQSRLLRVLENGMVYQLGSETEIKVDVRVIAATNRDIKKEINNGNFKKELLYRLNVLNLEIPPLRERIEDIPELVNYFIKDTENHTTADESVFEKLMEYDWPGNVRELSNTILRAVIASNKNIITAEDIVMTNFTREKKIIIPLKKAVTKFKKDYIIKALKYNSWNQMKTAEMLGIQRTYLSRLIKELDIFNNKE